MSPMDYGPDWVPPWKLGLRQARCEGPNCSPDGVPGALVVEMTLDEDGWCAACARTADTTHQELRLDT